MVNKEKFLLVSLSEDKTKKLSQAISNKTCRKILDYLAEKEATESELAEKLNIPISTVHYNLKQLQKGGLVVVEEYHYSEKGKEVNHYKLANKYIIIAPKSTYGIKEKLKSMLPVVLVIAAGSAFIRFLTRKAAAPPQEASMEMARITTEQAPAVGDKFSLFSSIALWFFIGAAVSLIFYLLVDWVRNRN